VVVAPKKVHDAIKKLEALFLELGNIKAVEYADELPEVDHEMWAVASDGEIQVLLDKIFSPTDIVEAVHVAELDPKGIGLLKPYITEMQELVRAKKVHVHEKQIEVKTEWHETKLDKKKVYVAVV